MDFPFAQPRRLVRNLGWPEQWDAVARLMGEMSITRFEDLLAEYRSPRPAGDKHHMRATDRLARSRSPMTLYGVPVARMFFRGAPRLERSPVSIIPCRPLDDDRLVVEAYPALVARRYIGRRSYKSDTRKHQTGEREQARRDLLRAVCSGTLNEDFGIELNVPDGLVEEFATDATADRLDALLCAVQTAWCWSQRDRHFGMPEDVDPLEGWIVDPGLVDGVRSEKERDLQTTPSP
jgi:hypothetical protein